MKINKWTWVGATAGAVIGFRWIQSVLNRYEWNDRVVLITGGSRGLGFALAKLLAQKGARLAICARTKEKLDIAKEEIESLGGEVFVCEADLTVQKQALNVVKQVHAHYGTIDVLINNAGIMQVGPVESMTIRDFEDAMDTNFWAALYMIQGCLPLFKKQGQGKIVNITSIGGKISVPHMLPYSASKFALVGLSEGLHAELKKDNISVTTVVPYLMRTGSPRQITVKGNHEAEYAWFKTLAFMPLIAQDAETAAMKIVHAAEYNEPYASPSALSHMSSLAKELAPGWMTFTLAVMNRFLPAMKAGGRRGKKGYRSESKLSRNFITSGSDELVDRYNEL